MLGADRLHLRHHLVLDCEVLEDRLDDLARVRGRGRVRVRLRVRVRVQTWTAFCLS